MPCEEITGPRSSEDAKPDPTKMQAALIQGPSNSQPSFTLWQEHVSISTSILPHL